ncbi:MAG: glucoamylase family protein [Caldimonas sp.]
MTATGNEPLVKDDPASKWVQSRALRRLQRCSFDYFVHEVNRANGMVLDKTTTDWPASIAAIGMALSAYPVGIERRFIDRDDAIERTLTTLRFLAASEQSADPAATGYKGFYYHFLEMESGRRAWQSELSSIDTALLIAGALTAAAYFRNSDPRESEIRALATLLYERVDWAWMLAGGDLLCHGWRPEDGFLPFRWEGYDEALVLYLLALGSPNHPIEPKSYDAWCRTYDWKTIYGIDLLYAGPLFVHQMSHIWCDFRGIRDRFMREHDADYFENSRRATQVQHEYAVRNPLGFPHVGEWCWGVTASDGPGKITRRIDGIERSFFDYVARGAPYGPDDGTIAPWAVAASLPFAPALVARTLCFMGGLHIHVPNPYGFKASFNPVFRGKFDDGIGWVSSYHFGINEGPTLLMIENHRTGMIWALMRQCPYLVAGLKAAGFSGGWLG